jgi:hypothetical protein
VLPSWDKGLMIEATNKRRDGRLHRLFRLCFFRICQYNCQNVFVLVYQINLGFNWFTIFAVLHPHLINQLIGRT